MNKPLATKSHQTIPLAASPIAAGPAVWVSEESMPIDVAALITGGREDCFAHELTGDSDLPHIQPGSLVFAFAYSEPRNGDMVVAEIDGLVCLKQFRHSTKGLYLVSRNRDKYAPRQVTAESSFRILGVYCAHLELHRR